MRTGTEDSLIPHRFPRTARVRARAEFDRVFKDGKRVATPVLALHWLKDQDGSPSRLGLAVSRKVDPRAVGRNRIKRALRESFRHLRPALRPGAYVVVARASAAHLPSEAVVAAFIDAARRAGALLQTHVDGTMPTASPTTTNAPHDSGE